MSTDSITKQKLTEQQIEKMTEKAFYEDLKEYKELWEGFFNSAYLVTTESGREAVLKAAPPAEVKPTIRSAQVPALASVLEETDDTVCISNLVTVVSDRSNYQANLGFVLREAGVYPSGFGEYATQDWTKITVGE